MEQEKIKEIKKALECCSNGSCKDCPYDEGETPSPFCINELAKDSLDYINELESENERLQEVNGALSCDLEYANEKLTNAEIEVDDYKDRIAELEEYIKGNEQDAKAFVNGWHKDLETELKQFATLLKVKTVLTPSGWCVNIEDIDETLKEFTEANND